jgi:GNAT superfamily N-acetyltransferase
MPVLLTLVMSDSEKMIFRDATEKDVFQLNGLYVDFCKEFSVPCDNFPKIGKGKFVVCEEKGLIGYGNVYPYKYGGKSYTYGEHIYVKPEFRNTGVGAKIYRALRKWINKEGRPIIVSVAKSEHAMWWTKGYRTLRFVMVKEIGCMK